MAEFRTIHSKMWRDSWYSELDVDGKLLWIYLITNDTVSIKRVYDISASIIAKETGIKETRVNVLLNQFSDSGKILTKEQYKAKERDRTSPQYIKWRKAVFSRDNYTCKNCGRHSGFLIAHHILSWAKFPEYRFNVKNGKTLCISCHKEIHASRHAK
jgi:hypothetical protein